MKELKGLVVVSVAMVTMAVMMVTGCASMDAMSKKTTLTEPTKATESTITPVTVADTKAMAETATTQKSKEVLSLPQEGKLSAVGSAEFKSEFKVLSTSLKKTEFFVPVSSGQMSKKWQISASWAWTDGEEWSLVPQDDYRITTEKVTGGAKATITFPKKGTGWYWIRIWGENKDQKDDWLWINQKDKHCRNDLEDNPGYESVVNPAMGKSQVVPTKYQTRK